MILSVCANPSVDSFWSVKWINKGITNRSKKETFYPGGKGIHVAFALKELGRDVTVLGTWGGQTGRWLKEKCAAQNIAAIGPDLEEWTRICITVKSSSRWDQTELLGNGPTIKAHEAEGFESLYQQFIKKKKPKAVVISGSVPNGFDHNIYNRLISLAGQFDIPCFIDATGPLLKQALKAKPFAVHINQHEGKDLWPTDDPAKIARRLGSFCQVAAVTAGEKGLYLYVDGEIYHASYALPSSKVISAVGSGDCLLAGLVAAISANEDPAYWAKYAAACGTANCVHPELGMLKSKDVDTIFEKVKLEKQTCDAE
ncbi:MAG TPA: hexose kinase [Balneolaceae bacterium]|nr:hexose kinase [Balneolaceae bacterium]